MISHRHRCIFVRISKTASQSILKSFVTGSDTEDDGYFGKAHHAIGHYRENYPEQFDRYFKCAFVRNPWARIYSQYRYQRYNLGDPDAQGSFAEWLERCSAALESGEVLFGRNRKIFVLHMTNQLDWLTIDGAVSVDFIGRFESIESDMKTMESRLGMPLELCHENSSGSYTGYRDAYDDNSRKIVAGTHAKDIDYFGYEF